MTEADIEHVISVSKKLGTNVTFDRATRKFIVESKSADSCASEDA